MVKGRDSMFCPNCGKDCGEFKFCPDCGTKLSGNSGKTSKKLVFPEPPIGVYRFGDDYIQFGEYGIKICKKDLTYGTLIWSVPYEKIAVVTYTEEKNLLAGYICIRSKLNKHVPSPIKYLEAVSDKGCVIVPKRKKEIFYRLYLFLKECADIVKAAETECGEEQEENHGKALENELILPDSMIGTYYFEFGYIKLEKYGLIIHKKYYRQAAKDYCIAYDEVAAVAYVAEKKLTPAFICVRSKQDEHVPCPATFDLATYDKGCATVPGNKREVFGQLYLFLKRCADIVNAAEKD